MATLEYETRRKKEKGSTIPVLALVASIMTFPQIAILCAARTPLVSPDQYNSIPLNNRIEYWNRVFIVPVILSFWFTLFAGFYSRQRKWAGIAYCVAALLVNVLSAVYSIVGHWNIVNF